MPGLDGWNTVSLAANCLTGKSPQTLSSPFRKNIPLASSGKSVI
jgi:hypothetical protein